jgi:hypothetical protein
MMLTAKTVIMAVIKAMPLCFFGIEWKVMALVLFI